MIICFDGDYPELSRIQAVQGAEMICRPSALLRSADIWELTTRARAYDNHVYVIGANATGIDPAGVLYFGNSLIVTPIAEMVARPPRTRAGSRARLDPADGHVALTPGSDIAAGLRPPRRPQPAPAHRLSEGARQRGPDPRYRSGAVHDPDRHRHRRHVHRRRRVRRGHRRLVTTKTPSTPADPAEGFLAGVHKVLALLGRSRGRRRGQPRHDRRHQPAAARARSADSASSPPRATSSSWRSPGSRCRTATATATSGSSRPGSCPPTWSRRVGGRLDHDRRRGPPVRRGRRREAARLLQSRGRRHDRGLLPALLRQPRPRAGDARRPRRGAPRRGGVAVLRGAARVPRVRAVDDHAGRRRGEAHRRPATSPHRAAARRPGRDRTAASRST